MLNTPDTIVFTAIRTVIQEPLVQFMVARLYDHYGASWWTKGVLPHLSAEHIKNLAGNVHRDPASLSGEIPADDPLIGFLEVVHCRNVIVNNWKPIFTSAFKDDQKVLDALKEIKKARDATAHYKYDKYEAIDDLKYCAYILEYIDRKASKKLEPFIQELFQLEEGSAAGEKAAYIPRFNPEKCVVRQKKIDEVSQLLLGEDPTPTVAIVGEPGFGKVHLAQVIASQLADKFPGGVIWCEADKTDVKGVVLSLADQLHVSSLKEGIKQQPQLVWDMYISDQPVLVVIARADRLYEGLIPVGKSCQTILTLSNRLLPVQWELPEKAIVDLHEMDEAESLELLQKSLNDPAILSEAEATRDLLKLLGGMPLAIDMAAKFLNKNHRMSLRDYIKEFTLIRVTPQEKIGVRRVFEVSLEAGADQDLHDFFATLGVCAAGSFSPEVALAVGKPIHRDPEAALSTLVDLSFLRRAEDGRYTIHPLIRLFARELAEKRGLLASAEERYYQWHEGLAAQYSVYIDIKSKEEMARNMPILARELAGILATAEGMLSRPGVDLFAWRDFWRNIRELIVSHGYYERGVDLLETALEISQSRNTQPDPQDGQTSPDLEAYFDAQLGKFYILAGQIDKAKTALQNARKIEKDKERIAHINTTLSKIRKKREDIEEAIALLQQNLDNRGEISAQSYAYSLNAMGRAKLVAGYPEEALGYFEQALEVESKEAMAGRSRSLTLSESGRALRKLGRHAEALANFETALELTLPLDDPRTISILNNEIGETLCHMDRYPEAIAHHLDALKYSNLMADSHGRLIALKRLLKSLILTRKQARALKDSRQWEQALPLIESWEQGEIGIGEKRHAYWAMIDHGDVLVNLNDIPKALDSYQKAMAIAVETKDLHGATIAAQCCARAIEKTPNLRDAEATTAACEAAYAQLQRVCGEADLTRLKRSVNRMSGKLGRLQAKIRKDEYWENIKQGDEQSKLGNHDQARQQYDSALEIAESFGDSRLRSIAHQCRARLLGGMDEASKQEALREWTRAELLLYEVDSTGPEEISMLLVSKGRLLLEMKKYEAAEWLAEAALIYTPEAWQARKLRDDSSTRLYDPKRQMKVGLRGVIKELRSNDGFITLDQPNVIKSDGHFRAHSVDGDWNELHLGDRVIADWCRQKDGNWTAKRVIRTGGVSPVAPAQTGKE